MSRPPPAPGHSARVRLACADDDAQGQELEVFWECELDRAILDDEPWSELGERGFDSPDHFAAFLNTLRWNCTTATDPSLFQAPFRAGIKLDAYQMEPLRKALRLPRVNLFIADDTGLGKTIEAGLIVRELLLRRKVRTIVVAAPPSVLERHRATVEQHWEKGIGRGTGDGVLEDRPALDLTARAVPASDRPAGEDSPDAGRHRHSAFDGFLHSAGSDDEVDGHAEDDTHDESPDGSRKPVAPARAGTLFDQADASASPKARSTPNGRAIQAASPTPTTPKRPPRSKPPTALPSPTPRATPPPSPSGSATSPCLDRMQQVADVARTAPRRQIPGADRLGPQAPLPDLPPFGEPSAACRRSGTTAAS